MQLLQRAAYSKLDRNFSLASTNSGEIVFLLAIFSQDFVHL